MEAKSISINQADATLYRPYRITILIGYVCSIAGMSLDLVDYFQRDLVFLIEMNIVSLLLYLVSLSGFLGGKLRLNMAALLLIYTMVLNILATSIYFASNDLPDAQLDFMRGTFILAVFVSISGLILQKTHIIVINALYTASLLVIWSLSVPNYVTDNILFFILMIAAYSFAILTFMNTLRRSLMENQSLQQLVYMRDKEVLEKENELVSERAFRLQETLDLKNRELLSNVLILTQNLESKSKLTDKLKMLATQLDGASKKELLSILSDLSLADHTLNWTEFQQRFENVHQDYFLKLVHAYPDLSPSELKLAAFIKLGLSSKEISALINNTVSSVEVSRSRLRKKLKLSPEDNLVSFLAKF